MIANRRQLSFIVGGAATTFGLLYLIYNNYQKSRSGQFDLPREVALKVLRELRRELYPVFKKILKASKGMRMAARQQRRGPRSMPGDPLSSFDKIELCEIPEFREMIQSVESAVYTKYNLENKEIFEKFCLNLQRTDSEVNQLMTSIHDMYLQAKQGENIKLDFAVPLQISELAVITAQKELHRETLRALKMNMAGVGDGRMESEQNMRLIQKRIDEAHETIYRHNGFDVMEEFHPESVFEQACLKYARTSPEFKKKMQLIDHHFNNIVNQLLTGRMSLETLEEEFGRIDRFINPPKPDLVIEVVTEAHIVEPLPETISKPADIELTENAITEFPPGSEMSNGFVSADEVQFSDAPVVFPFHAVVPEEQFPKQDLHQIDEKAMYGYSSEFQPASDQAEDHLYTVEASNETPFEDVTTSHVDEEFQRNYS